MQDTALQICPQLNKKLLYNISVVRHHVTGSLLHDRNAHAKAGRWVRAEKG